MRQRLRNNSPAPARRITEPAICPATKQRNGDSESKYAKIERCLVQAHNSLGCDGDESLKQQVGKRAPRKASEQREKQTFRQCLPRQPYPACTKRRAHGELALPAYRSHQHQIRHVCTGKHQDRDYGAEQDPRANPRIFNLTVTQRTHPQVCPQAPGLASRTRREGRR